MSISAYQSNRINNRNFGNITFTVPTTVYFGLSTSPINFDGTGATEPSGNNYSRVAVANNKTTWGNSANGILSNLIQIIFPQSSGSWGTITNILLADASIAGNILYYDVLSPSRSVAASTTVLFDIGAVIIQQNNT